MQYQEAPAIIREFLLYMLNIQGRSQKTVDEYFFDLRVFFRFTKMQKYAMKCEFDSISISDIDVDFVKTISIMDVYEYLSYASSNRANIATTRSRKVSCIRSFFKYLTTKAHLLSENPVKELESPKAKKSLPKFLTLEESLSLLDNVDGKFQVRDYAILTLFLNCGLRLSELVGMNFKDLKEDTLRVVGKGNKQRIIYLNDACLDAIKKYISVRPIDGVVDRDALFISRQHNRISNKTVQHIVKKHLLSSGLGEYSTHKLRHTAATLMYKHGKVDVLALQEILGHEQLSTTQIYTHVDNEQLRAAASKNPLSNIKKVENSIVIKNENC